MNKGELGGPIIAAHVDFVRFAIEGPNFVAGEAPDVSICEHIACQIRIFDTFKLNGIAFFAAYDLHAIPASANLIE